MSKDTSDNSNERDEGEGLDPDWDATTAAQAYRRRALGRVRALLGDPTVPLDHVAAAALEELHIEVTFGGWTSYQAHGKGAVLVDLRSDSADGEIVTYYPRALFDATMRAGPFAPLMEALDTYNPIHDLLVLVALTPATLVYRVNRLLGALEPVTPFLSVDWEDDVTGELSGPDQDAQDAQDAQDEAARWAQRRETAAAAGLVPPEFDAEHRHALADLRARAGDPRLRADEAADLLVEGLTADLVQIAWRNSERNGRGAVLIDARPETAEDERMMYIPRALLDDPLHDLGSLTPLARAMEIYNPPAEALAIVMLTAVVRVYQLTYRGDAPPTLLLSVAQ